jgi:hypothetical protein
MALGEPKESDGISQKKDKKKKKIDMFSYLINL